MSPHRRMPTEYAREAARRAAAHLAKDPRVRLVYLFGSASDGATTGVRDIDLAVRTSPPLAFDERLRLAEELAEIVEVSFDLVSIDNSSIVLAREIADHGECLFTRSPDDEVDFVTKARLEYLDFKPFLEMQWRYAGERQEVRRRGPQA